MSDDMSDGGPVYPGPTFTQGGHPCGHSMGMSLRDWFAGQALISTDELNPNLPGDPAHSAVWPAPEDLAKRRAAWSYLQADAMLAARCRPAHAESAVRAAIDKAVQDAAQQLEAVRGGKGE